MTLQNCLIREPTRIIASTVHITAEFKLEGALAPPGSSLQQPGTVAQLTRSRNMLMLAP